METTTMKDHYGPAAQLRTDFTLLHPQALVREKYKFYL